MIMQSLSIKVLLPTTESEIMERVMLHPGPMMAFLVLTSPKIEGGRFTGLDREHYGEHQNSVGSRSTERKDWSACQ